MSRIRRIRILRRSKLGLPSQYYIQTPHWLFRWWWVDRPTSRERKRSDLVPSTFSSLEEAMAYTEHFDGSKPLPDKVVWSSSSSGS